MYGYMDISSDYYGPFNVNTNLRGSFSTYYIAHSWLLPFSNTSILVVLLPPIYVKGVPLIPLTVSISPLLFQDLGATPLRSVGPYCSGVVIQIINPTPFSEVVHYQSFCVHKTRLRISFQETRYIHDTKEQVVALRQIHRRKTNRATGCFRQSHERNQ